jgi:hypothetical protein
MLRNAINKVLLLAAPTQITDHVAATDVRACVFVKFCGVTDQIDVFSMM